MGAEYLSYVRSIATFAPTFYGYIISVLASVFNMLYKVCENQVILCSIGNLCDRCQEIRDEVLEDSSSGEPGNDESDPSEDSDIKERKRKALDYIWSDLESAKDSDWGSTHAGQHPDCEDCEIVKHERFIRSTHNGQHSDCEDCEDIRRERSDFGDDEASRFFVEQIENGCLARACRPSESNDEECTSSKRCAKCKEMKESVLATTSEESGGEDDDDDTDWDDPHNGQHPNCSECDEIRADNCNDNECHDHGTGDTEGFEGPPEGAEPADTIKAIEQLQNRQTDRHREDNIEIVPIDPEEAAEIIKVIEQLQKDTEQHRDLAANAIKELKMTTRSTKEVKNYLKKEMEKQKDWYRSLTTDFHKLSKENEKMKVDTEKVKKDLEKLRSERPTKPEAEVASQYIDRQDVSWTFHHNPPGKKIKDFICMKDIECTCDAIDKETSRTKTTNAGEGLKEAICCQRSGQGATIESGGNTYVNCHKYHGKKLFFIIKYALSLPGISEEIEEIWKMVRDAQNIITRRDLVRISVILGRYANEVEDGVLVEHDRAMFSADLDFMSVQDETVDNFSTDEETLETINSTSHAFGAATGARPKSGDQSRKKGHYTREKGDIAFKNELKRRNDQELKRRKDLEEEDKRKKERLQKFESWKNKNWKEVDVGIKAKAQLYHQKAQEIVREKERKRALEAKRLHEVERKKAWSARRAARHPRERNREKIKIPALPGEDGKSSVTYYTSTTVWSSTTDSDSVPELV
jgi:hypothetical protein